jgi:hypothetical protein
MSGISPGPTLKESAFYRAGWHVQHRQLVTLLAGLTSKPVISTETLSAFSGGTFADGEQKFIPERQSVAMSANVAAFEG